MNAGNQPGQGVAFPPRISPDGSIAWSGGAANINESISLILLTNRGERVGRPEFGASLRTFIFEPNTASTRRLIQAQIETSLAKWEQRITVVSAAVLPDPADQQAVSATIAYVIKGSGTQETVSLRLPLAEGGG